MSEQASPWRRLGQYLGFAYGREGRPENRGLSRYVAGRLVSRRLDEDIDALRDRLDEVERRLRQ